MSGLSDVQIMFVSAAIGATFIFIVGGVAWLIRERRNAPMAKAVPLDDLMDGPVEQVGDDTLAMVAEDRAYLADMWDSFEEANVHGIEVDDTAAEADMVNANGPAVVAQERALVADLEAWLRGLDVEAWLGERGWL